MANTKRLVLMEITLFVVNTVINSSVYDIYLDDEGLFFDNPNIHSSLELLEAHEESSYYLVESPIYAVKFISDINNNVLVKDSEDFIEALIESISYYNKCNIEKLYKDTKDLFFMGRTPTIIPDYIKKYGYEKRKFIGVFDEYSYFDSYAGDGDHIIEYENIVNLSNINDELIKVNNNRFDNLFKYYVEE
jgi:hypothetical protein